MTVWLSPGDPRRRTGGYCYNARIVAACGHRVLALPGQWPVPSAEDTRRCGALIAQIPDGEVVVLDGLALIGALPWLPALRQRARLVLLVHLPLSAERGTPPAEAARLHALEARAVSLAHRVVATSPHAATTVSALHGCPVDAIAPGCDPMPQAAVSGAGRLLCVGSVTPRKGHDILITALRPLAALPWRLRCAGEVSPWASRLQPDIDALGGRVRLLGSLGEARVRQEYADADAFVLATWDETYGMALAEATAAGLPVISTTAGAVPQTVPPGAGLLVPPGDAGALTEALRAVLTDTARRSAMAAAARAAPRRGWETAARAWQTLLEEVV